MHLGFPRKILAQLGWRVKHPIILHARSEKVRIAEMPRSVAPSLASDISLLVDQVIDLMDSVSDHDNRACALHIRLTKRALDRLIAIEETN